MEKYLDTLFFDICEAKFNSEEKEKCLFEFGFAVEKVLLIIYLFAKKYNIQLSYYYININNCTYNEILSIGKMYYFNSDNIAK